MFFSRRTKQDKQTSIFYTDTFLKWLEFILFRFLFDEPHLLHSLAPVIITILGSNSIIKTTLFYCFDQINLYESIWISFTKICLKLVKSKYLWEVLIMLIGMEKYRLNSNPEEKKLDLLSADAWQFRQSFVSEGSLRFC